MTRLLTALIAAAVFILIAVAAPAGASAHRARQASYRHHHAAKHPKGRRGHGNRRHKRRHAHKRGHRHFAAKHHPRHVKHATHTKPARRADTGTCPGASLMPGPANLEAVREATLCLINRERVTRGERALKPDGKLQGAAQSHSESMASNDYFGHEGPGGSTPVSRMRTAGYIYNSNVGYEIGENIAWGTLSLATPKAIVESWMSSPEHRENILDPNYRDTGMGVSPHAPASQAAGQAGAIYTQDFGVIITG